MTFFVQTFYREFYHIGSEEAISNWSGKHFLVTLFYHDILRKIILNDKNIKLRTFISLCRTFTALIMAICQVSKGGIQNKIDLWKSLYFVNSVESSKIGHHFRK